MILEKDFKERTVEIIGETNDRMEMGIDAENITHLMMILSSNMYQNAVGSIVREYTSNAIDANVEADCEEPVIVRLKREPTGNLVFEVEDFGPGLDDVDFRKVISKYGKSTKRDKENQLGFYGLGTKSAFSYTNTFYYTCRKDGVERKYLMYKSETGFTIDLMFESKTDKVNGVIVTIPVKSTDYQKFRNEIRNQLAYFDNVYFDVDYEYIYNDYTKDLNEDFSIYKEEDFQYSSLAGNKELHISFGRVNYPIDWTILGISRISLPLALKFEINSGLFPIPNRENLIWNDATKKLVLDKIAKVSDWFIQRYNTTVESKDTLFQGWEFINVTKRSVILNDKEFLINQLQDYATIKAKEVQIKNIKLLSPSSYKSKLNYLTSDYRIVAEFFNDRFKSKNIYLDFNNVINKPGKTLLLNDDDIVTGYFRDYIKTLGYNIFVKRKPESEIKAEDLIYFKQILFLQDKNKNKWRDTIKEYQEVKKEFISEIFVDGRDLSSSKEFAEFKLQMKKKRVCRVKNVNALNKQLGEVTIAFNVSKRWGGQMFKKQTCSIDSLHKKPFLTFIVPEYYVCDKAVAVFKSQKVRFAKIGVQDLKKIEKLKLHNFMKINEINNTKVFKRVATGLLAKKLVDIYDVMNKTKHEVIQNLTPRWYDLYNKCKDYSNKHVNKDYGDFAESVLATAKQNNLWDTEHIDYINEFEKLISQYNFLNLITLSDTDECRNLINTILLFKKHKYEEKYNDLQITLKEKTDEDSI